MSRFRTFGVVALTAVALFTVPSIAHADHFRGGYITWKLLPSPANTVRFRSVQLWRAGAVTPLEINPGDPRPGFQDLTIAGPASTRRARATR
jgi:hypothetical protein